jgi:lysozyme family protein
VKSNYEAVADLIFLKEGGYAERDSEPGGAVNMGISFTAFKDWWAKHKKTGEPTWADLKALTREQAEEIYRDWFFTPIHFNVLPYGVDYALVDLVVNSGVGGGLRALQKHLGFDVTGKIDTNTAPGAQFLWALKTRNPDDMIDKICDARLELMRSSHKWERWKHNWEPRVAWVRERAHKMAERGGT